MTFVDWSDSEGMFGLLLDFVADARAECQTDLERQQFLSELSTELEAVDAAEAPLSIMIQKLRDARGSIDVEFEDDPVTFHLEACIEELERVERGEPR